MVADGREVARRALRRVFRDDAYATLALGGELSRLNLDARERALATEITYGVLRRLSRLDRALESKVEKRLKVAPAIRVALQVAAYQLLFLERVPAHAAVDDAVTAIKRTAGARMAGFANKILRRLADEGEPRFAELPRLEKLALEHCVPVWIAEELEKAVGQDETEPALAALAEPAPLCLRVNLRKTSREEVAETLGEERPGVEVLSLRTASGLRVTGAGSPDSLRSFQEGLWSVQDEAAQLVGEVVAPAERVLDACAGVGGKTTHLAERFGDEVELWALDTSQQKLDLLADSCRRLGISSVRSHVVDVLKDDWGPCQGPFGTVLLDAPCTGLGVLRRHPEAKWRLRREDIAEMATTQARMLDRLAREVAPGGQLVYSVCSFTRQEGEAQVEAFLKRHGDFHQESAARTWPHEGGRDAFFYATLRRAPDGAK